MSGIPVLYYGYYIEGKKEVKNFIQKVSDFCEKNQIEKYSTHANNTDLPKYEWLNYMLNIRENNYLVFNTFSDKTEKGNYCVVGIAYEYSNLYMSESDSTMHFPNLDTPFQFTDKIIEFFDGKQPQTFLYTTP